LTIRIWGFWQANINSYWLWCYSGSSFSIRRNYSCYRAWWCNYYSSWFRTKCRNV